MLAAGVALVALLYSCVGHGGASGYLALLALLGHDPAQMKGAALLLNILVAGLAFLSYWREGHFDAAIFWPLAAASIPLAFLGGLWRLPASAYSLLLASVLAFAAFRLLMPDRHLGPEASQAPRIPHSLAAGGSIGLLSGLVGVGGGIFLSPLMILRRWADPKTTAGVCAAFIWVNSLAGLYGHLSRGGVGGLSLWPLAAAAAAGGAAGSAFGARRLDTAWLRRLLAVVLMIACYKLLRVALR